MKGIIWCYWCRFYCSAHRACGNFRYVLTVVCRYHLHFLGPYSIITHRGLGLVLCLLYQGVLELILLSWFIVCCECFIHPFSSRVQGRSPSRGPGDGVPQKLEHFKKYTAYGQVKMKDIIWCHWWRFLLQCTPGLCCFSVMLHNVWHLGDGPLAPPINPPLLAHK